MTKKETLREDLQKAVDRLNEAVKLPETMINKDATIQRFEFTFELSWKLMQDMVNEQIPNTYGPKNVIREAARLKIIDDPEIWFDFLKKRNLATHTYNENIANEVYASSKKFPEQIAILLKNLEGM